MKILYAVVFLLAFFLPGYFLPAESQEIPAIPLPVTVYNVEQGLGQSTVNQVYQDHRGLIWVATGDGLQHFDGERFSSFTPPPFRPYSSPGNNIRNIAEIAPGTFGLTTRSATLGFDSRAGSFSMLAYRSNENPWLSGEKLGGVTLGWTASDGFFRIREGRTQRLMVRYVAGGAPPAGFFPVGSAGLVAGRVVVAGERGFLALDPPLNNSDTVVKARWVPAPGRCRTLATGPGGRLYLLSDGVIYRVDDGLELTTEFDTQIRECDILFIDRAGSFWYSNNTRKGFFRKRGQVVEEILFVTRAGNRTDTLRPDIRTVFEDRHGNLWFGTDGNGLLFHPRSLVSFDLAQTGFTRCLAFYAGDIWAGTFRNGLWRMKKDLTGAHRVNPAVFTGELSIFDLAGDNGGRLWVITNRGLFVLNRDGTLAARDAFMTLTASFLRLPQGGFMLSAYDRLYTCHTGDRPGITPVREQTHVREFLRWKGSYYTGSEFGLYRTDTTGDILRALSFDPSCRRSQVPVNCILPVDDLLWTGTEKGIIRYDAGGREVPLPAIAGFPDREVVYSLIADGQGRVWFSAAKGVGMIARDLSRVVRFSLLNNLQSTEFNNNADLYTPDGRIYFGGIRGLNSLSTKGFSLDRPVPEVRLLSLTVSDTLYSRGIPADGLRLVPDRKHAHIGGSVFTPDYLAPGSALFSFFLEGYHDGWTPPSTGNTFAFRSLPPGSYSLWARCSDLFGNPGPSVRLFRVVIHPPLWKTTGFMVLAVIAIVLITVVVINRLNGMRYRSRLKDLERRNAIDRERLRISRDMHDEVGASLTQIAILSELVRKKREEPAEMMKLIDRISGISSTVVDDMSEIIWAMNPKNDNLTSFLSYLRSHASTYLSDAGLRADLSFPDDAPDFPMTSEQRRNLFLVVKEALHNTVKHAGASRAWLKADLNGRSLTLAIRDDGTGFIPETCAGKGNGLSGMHRRIADLQGTFVIESAPGRGTLIHLSVMLAGG